MRSAVIPLIHSKTASFQPSNSPRNSASNPSQVNPHETSFLGQFRSERPSSRETPRRESDLENGDSHQTHYDARLNSDSVIQDVHDKRSYTRYQRTRHKIDQKSTRENSLGEQMNESSRNETFENGLYTTSTPRRENFELDPGLSTMTFSYKSPPTRRHPRRKTAEDLIW